MCMYIHTYMYTGTLPLPNNSFVRSTVRGNNKTYSETYSNRQDSMLSEIKYATTRRIARRIEIGPHSQKSSI